MKKYYIEYTRNFSNTYNLYWADESNADCVTENMERISREIALNMCSQEDYRRKYDQSCSGYADNRIYPIDYDAYALSMMGHSFILEPNEHEHRIMEWPSESVQKEAQKIVQDYEKMMVDNPCPWC